MGRQIRRVPLDFKWEMDKVWKGFICPHRGYQHNCPHCKGSGYNKATKQLSDDWYDNDGFGNRWWYEYNDEGRACKIIEKYPGACRRWLDKLTQDEVDHLASEMRFASLTHDWVDEEGWVPKDPMPQVPAEEINRANSVGARGFGHDAINHYMCVEVRAKRLGVWGKCEHCNGSGTVVTQPEVKKLADEWEPEGPPEGEGWQVWETVSEGSPITPVFSTPEGLIDHLVNVGAWGRTYSREAAEAFVMSESGWVPSMIGVPGVGLLSGIDAAPYLGGNRVKRRGDSDIEEGFADDPG